MCIPKLCIHIAGLQASINGFLQVGQFSCFMHNSQVLCALTYNIWNMWNRPNFLFIVFSWPFGPFNMFNICLDWYFVIAFDDVSCGMPQTLCMSNLTQYRLLWTCWIQYYFIKVFQFQGRSPLVTMLRCCHGGFFLAKYTEWVLLLVHVLSVLESTKRKEWTYDSKWRLGHVLDVQKTLEQVELGIDTLSVGRWPNQLASGLSILKAWRCLI